MLRSFFVYLSKAAWARQVVTRWGFARRTASRFVAGEKLEDAIAAIRTLNSKNIHATLDHLGEHTTNPDEACRAVQELQKALDGIEQSGVQSNISVKLTQIGLALDPGLCERNLREILDYARQKGNFVRIDMEDSPVAQITLDLLHKMRAEGFDNVGIVIQAYLFRSEEDIAQLIKDCIKVRLCKGAYKEPAEIAYPNKKDVDAAFDRLGEALIKGSLEQGCPLISPDGRIPPLVALATHDEKRVLKAKAYAQELGFPKDALEFQMLYGIRRDLQESLAGEGYPVRVYVPYGTEWYPYYMRRLGERPANIWFFLTNFIKR